MSSLIKNVGTIGGLTAVSRVFGFIRDMVTARVLGAGLAADAWQLAFTLPNTFRRLRVLDRQVLDVLRQQPRHRQGILAVATGSGVGVEVGEDVAFFGHDRCVFRLECVDWHAR